MMGNVGRREFVQGVGLVVGALAATAGYPPALAQLTTNVGSKPMTYEIKPLRGDTQMPRLSWCAALAAMALAAPAGAVLAQSAAPDAKPYQVEWVYRVKYGYQEEFWRIFQKYQIATLDRARELGYVASYTVVRPALHASEDSRWDYRIVVTFTSPAAVARRVEVERALFPDKATRQREENRRWELVLNHWDLPIREIDPHADPE
jgi:hypothetical protein